MSEKWVRTRQRLPVFNDASLTWPAKLHIETCRVRIENDRERDCSCGNSNSSTSEHAAGQILEERDSSYKIAFRGFKPVWVEKAGLQALRKKPDPYKVQRGPPADLVALQQALFGDKPAEFGRRRRPIVGGELVFIRSSMRDGILEPMRYLCLVNDNGTPTAILVRPELQSDQALAPDWTDIVHVEAPDFDPARALFPAFPLPDGTASPGWIPTEGEPIRPRKPRSGSGPVERE